MNNSEILYWDEARGDIRELSFATYPDGMPIVNQLGGFGKIKRILVRPSNLTSFMASMFFIDALEERGYSIPELILPFVPGARQDRKNIINKNKEGDFLFTAKSIAKIINDRKFSRVTIVDPHSEVIAGLIDRSHVIYSDRLLEYSYVIDFKEFDCIISPDAGAEKRASLFAKKLKLPLIHAWKTRDISTGAISGFGIEPNIQKFTNALIIDDICDGGGTFLGLAQELPSNNQFNVSLFTSHGIYSQGLAKLNNKFAKLFTTDSLIQKFQPDALAIPTVFPICEMLMKGYY